MLQMKEILWPYVQICFIWLLFMKGDTENETDNVSVEHVTLDKK